MNKIARFLKATRFKRNVIIHDNSPRFEGDWIAVPREDFDEFRNALADIDIDTLRQDPTISSGWRVRAAVALQHLGEKDRESVLREFDDDPAPTLLELLGDYLDARERQKEAILADRNQLEEDATLDVEMYEKRLHAFLDETQAARAERLLREIFTDPEVARLVSAAMRDERK